MRSYRDLTRILPIVNRRVRERQPTAVNGRTVRSLDQEENAAENPLLRLHAVKDNSAMETEPSKADPPKGKRRWFQYSLRTLLIFTLLFAIASAWLVRIEKRAERQKAAVEALLKAGGAVFYNYQLNASWATGVQGKPSGPVWLRRLLGNDAFDIVVDANVKTDAGIESVMQFDRLRGLVVGTDVTDAGFCRLCELNQLESLVLEGERWNDLALQYLPGLRGLRELTINRAQVSDAGLRYLEGLGQLQYLSLWRTNVTDDGLTQVKKLRHLQKLILCETKITDAGIEQLAGLDLRLLWIANTKVSDAGLESVGQISSLEQLSLGDTRVSDKGLAALTRLTNLTHLALTGSDVTDAGIVYLKSLPKLQEILIGATKVSDAALKDLQKALPNCKILR